jgi:hypothetical protein
MRAVAVAMMFGCVALVAGCAVEDNPRVCDEARQDFCANGLMCVHNECVVPDGGLDDGAADAVDAPYGDGPRSDAAADDRDGATAGDGGDGGIACRADDDCKGNARGERCDVVSGACVGCVSHEQCSSPAKPLCSAERVCVACNAAGAATCGSRAGALPMCDPASGACVECLKSDDCPRASPICDGKHRCVPCTTDAQCADRKDGPGVCLVNEAGRCATNDETVFLESRSGCAGAAVGDGSSGNPFCGTKRAIDALAPGKRVIKARSKTNVPLDGFTYARTDLGGAATIVGDGVVAFESTADAVHVSAGEIHLRGLRISSRSGTGVVVDPGATLHMSRCTVHDSGAGGLYVNGGGFDVTNTVLANNQKATAGYPVEFGGAYLLGVNGKPQRFSYNTVAGNEGFGVFCEVAIETRGLLLAGTGVNKSGCTLVASVEGTVAQARFAADRPFHLTPESPCVNAGEAAGSPDVPFEDLDGQSRPRDAKLDCGADELDP